MQRTAAILAGIFIIVLASVTLFTGPTPTLYGATLADMDITPLEQIHADPAAFAGQEVLVSGTIDKVCQGDGCWLALNVDGSETFLVRFMQEDFRVPNDIASHKARVMGVVSLEMAPEHDHKGDMAGDPDHECPTDKLAIMAKGVEVI